MLTAFMSLICCQLAGELIREIFHLPIPGPVIGMFLLAAVLVLRTGKSGDGPPSPLEATAETLIAYMGILFVPAGVGIVAEGSLLREEWLPIVGGVVGSTITSIAVTGLVMHWTLGKRASDHGIIRSPEDRKMRRSENKGPRHTTVAAKLPCGVAEHKEA